MGDRPALALTLRLVWQPLQMTSVGKHAVLKQTAYMLLYERSSPKPEQSRADPVVVTPPSDSAEGSDVAGMSEEEGGRKLCSGGCGFYGTAEKEGMCSQCYAKAKGLVAKPTPKPAAAATASPQYAPRGRYWCLGKAGVTTMCCGDRMTVDDLMNFARMTQMRRAAANAAPRRPAPTTASRKPKTGKKVRLCLYDGGQVRRGALYRDTALACDVFQVKPNAPCPCGSGRKYKKCHGRR